MAKYILLAAQNVPATRKKKQPKTKQKNKYQVARARQDLPKANKWTHPLSICG